MTSLQVQPCNTPPPITWEKLPADFPLPDEPVGSNLQPLLAAALRESLELAGLILDSMIIATNFGICATVGSIPNVEICSAGILPALYIKGARCSHYRIFWKNWDAPPQWVTKPLSKLLIGFMFPQ